MQKCTKRYDTSSHESRIRFTNDLQKGGTWAISRPEYHIDFGKLVKHPEHPSNMTEIKQTNIENLLTFTVLTLPGKV